MILFSDLAVPRVRGSTHGWFSRSVVHRISGPPCAVCSQGVGGNKDRAGAAGRESRIELLVKRAKSKLGANLGMKRRAKVGAADEQGLLEHTDKANLRLFAKQRMDAPGVVSAIHTPT